MDAGSIALIIAYSVAGIIAIIWAGGGIIESILTSKSYEMHEEVQRLKKENRKLNKQIEELKKK